MILVTFSPMEDKASYLPNTLDQSLVPHLTQEQVHLGLVKQ